MTIGSMRLTSADVRRLACAAALLLLPSVAHGQEAAQGYITLQNKWKNSYLQAAGAALSEGTDPGAPATHWAMVAAGPQNPKAFRLRSTDGKSFLHFGGGSLEVSEAKSNWEQGSALWTLEQTDGAEIRLKNVAHPEAFLNNETGKLAAGPVQPSWQSALWSIQVTLTIDNLSAAPLDVFVDDDGGTPSLVTSVPAGNRLVQLTPPGATWRLAQNDNWMGGITATANPFQRLRFPTSPAGADTRSPPRMEVQQLPKAR
jgi:hypothetical protein